MHNNFLLSMLVLFTMVSIVVKISMIRNDFILFQGYWAWRMEEVQEHREDWFYQFTQSDFNRMEEAVDRCVTKFWHKWLGSAMEWDQV